MRRSRLQDLSASGDLVAGAAGLAPLPPPSATYLAEIRQTQGTLLRPIGDPVDLLRSVCARYTY